MISAGVSFRSWLVIGNPLHLPPSLPCQPHFSPGLNCEHWISPRTPGSFRTMCFCLYLSLSIPFSCLHSLTNSYSSFRTQLPCLSSLTCSWHFPEGIILLLGLQQCFYPCPWEIWKRLSSCIKKCLYLQVSPSSTPFHNYFSVHSFLIIQKLF